MLSQVSLERLSSSYSESPYQIQRFHCMSQICMQLIAQGHRPTLYLRNSLWMWPEDTVNHCISAYLCGTGGLWNVITREISCSAKPERLTDLLSYVNKQTFMHILPHFQTGSMICGVKEVNRCSGNEFMSIVQEVTCMYGVACMHILCSCIISFNGNYLTLHTFCLGSEVPWLSAGGIHRWCVDNQCTCADKGWETQILLPRVL